MCGSISVLAIICCPVARAWDDSFHASTGFLSVVSETGRPIGEIDSTALAAQHLQPRDRATPKTYPTSIRQSSVADSKNDEVALANAEALLVARTSIRKGLDPDQALDQAADLPAFAESAAQEQSAIQRRFHYHFGLATRLVYDDNVNLGQSIREADFYASIEPNMNLGFGDISGDGNFIDLNYTAQAFLFFDHTENNALQHIITLTGQYRFPRLTLSLSQNIQILDGTGLDTLTGTGTTFTRTNLDVARRAKLNIYSTRVDANYSLTGKLFLTGGLRYTVTDYASLISSSVISSNLYLNYTYSPKLAIGLGVAGGYNSIDSPSRDQTYEQINARASYELTGKVSATVSAGVEFRQTAGGGSNNGSPVFDGSLFYQPFDGTSVALSLFRRTLNSATLAGQDFYSTSVIFSVRQRFLQRLFVGLTLGYQNSSYFSTSAGIDASRVDDYFFLQGSLDLKITSYWTAGIFYLYRDSDSTFDAFSFYDNRFGVHSTLTF